MTELLQTGGLFWITSRGAGTAALVLASLAVGIGLMSSSKGPLGKRMSEMRHLHEALALATLAAVVVHGLALLGDQYVGYSPTEIAIPFASNYRTFWTSLGIVSFYGLAALGLGYYQRKRIGVQRWKVLHRFTSAFWVLGLIHSLGMGTDRGAPWFLLMVGVTAAPAMLLLLWRILEPRDAPTPARAPASQRLTDYPPPRNEFVPDFRIEQEQPLRAFSDRHQS